jgi:hypothetical protein
MEISADQHCVLCSFSVPDPHLPMVPAAPCMGALRHSVHRGECTAQAAQQFSWLGGEPTPAGCSLPEHCCMLEFQYEPPAFVAKAMHDVSHPHPLCCVGLHATRSGLWWATTAATAASTRTTWWRTLWAHSCSCHSSTPLSHGASSTTTTTHTPTSELWCSSMTSARMCCMRQCGALYLVLTWSAAAVQRHASMLHSRAVL